MAGYTRNELFEMTNDELRNICRDMGLSRYSKANKTTLVDMIMGDAGGGDGVASASSDEGSSFALIRRACTQLSVPVAGMTIGDVAVAYRDILNIPANANALVGGSRVSNNYVIKCGDNVEFVSPAGQKG